MSNVNNSIDIFRENVIIYLQTIGGIIMYKNNRSLPYILTSGILGILLGTLLLVIDFSKILSLIFVIIGAFILIANLPAFIFSVTSLNIFGIITSSLPILAGIVMIFWHSTVLLYIIGAYLVVLPLVRVLLSSDKQYALRIELPRLIIGLLLFIIGPGTAFNALFDVAGYIVIAFSLIFMIVGILKSR